MTLASQWWGAQGMPRLKKWAWCREVVFEIRHIFLSLIRWLNVVSPSTQKRSLIRIFSINTTTLIKSLNYCIIYKFQTLGKRFSFLNFWLGSSCSIGWVHSWRSFQYTCHSICAKPQPAYLWSISCHQWGKTTSMSGYFWPKRQNSRVLSVFCLGTPPLSRFCERVIVPRVLMHGNIMKM